MIDLLAAKRQLLSGGYPGLRKKDSAENEGVNAAALANAQLSKEALDWFKTKYDEEKPARDAAIAAANKTTEQQLAIAQQNADISKGYWDYQKGTFRPLEQGLVADAQNYDTADRREAEAGQATANVSTQFANARDNMRRSVAATTGVVDPTSGNLAAQERAMAVQEAAARASAANTARKGVELQGYARKMDAANLGRGLASSQATSAGVALNAGNSAVGNAQVPVQIGQQATAQVGQGYSQAVQANQSAGNLYAQAAQLNQSGTSSALSGLFSGVGGIAQGIGAAGGIAQFFSDRNMKRNVRSVKDDEALEEVREIPVKEWDYKPGAGDGGHHIGPMAQDVNEEMGETAAPGGKVIDLITLNGKNMAAIRALDKKVERIAKKVGVTA